MSTMRTSEPTPGVEPRRPVPGPTILDGQAQLYPLSVEQYHAAIAAGVFTEDDPVELIDGMLVFKMPKNPHHRFAIGRLIQFLGAGLPEGWFYLSEQPITLEDGEPEPDGTVVRGSDRDFVDHHPEADDVALVIEIAESSHQRDRGSKLRAYARAGIAVYWLIDLPGRCVEVYTQPHGELYGNKVTIGEAEVLTLSLDAHVLTTKVGDLLP